MKRPETNHNSVVANLDVRRGRSKGSDTKVSPRDSIIASATTLFATKGYVETTMIDIAKATNLHQSSLYYWFRSKEQILQAAFAVNRAPVDFISSVAILPGSSGLKLYRFIRFDTYQVCTAPCDPNEVEQAAERQPRLFKEFWEDRQRLHDVVVTLLHAGIDDKEFVDCDAELAALLIVSVDEGIQKRVRFQKQHAPKGKHPFRHSPYDPKVVAEFVAYHSLRSLLMRPGDLKRIVSAAAQYEDFSHRSAQTALR